MHIEIVLFRKSLPLLKWKTHELQKRKKQTSKMSLKNITFNRRIWFGNSRHRPKERTLTIWCDRNVFPFE